MSFGITLIIITFITLANILNVIIMIITFYII